MGTASLSRRHLHNTSPGPLALLMFPEPSSFLEVLIKVLLQSSMKNKAQWYVKSGWVMSKLALLTWAQLCQWPQSSSPMAVVSPSSDELWRMGRPSFGSSLSVYGWLTSVRKDLASSASSSRMTATWDSSPANSSSPANRSCTAHNECVEFPCCRVGALHQSGTVQLFCVCICHFFTICCFFIPMLPQRFPGPDHAGCGSDTGRETKSWLWNTNLYFLYLYK